MKKTFFTILLISALFNLKAQNIPNGDFENWINHTWIDPTGCNTGNIESVSANTTSTATRGDDKQNGSYALKLETIISGKDTLLGYCLWGKFDKKPLRGIAYRDIPTSLTGYYKYNIVDGDKGYIGVWFWKDGVAGTPYLKEITGSQNTYTSFSIDFAGLLSPDSVTIGITSSNPFITSNQKSGSWVMVDNLAFTGTNIQQLSNGDFENWSDKSIEEPEHWANYSISLYSVNASYLEKSSDSKSGAALKITSISVMEDNGKAHFFNQTFIGENYFTPEYSGFPYTGTKDTVVFYYKYIPITVNDSAKLQIYCKKDKKYIYEHDTLLAASSTYKQFKFPIQSSTPDTLQIFISSSKKDYAEGVGSVLYIDNIHLKSTELATSIEQNSKEKISVFPNPVQQFLNIQYTNENNRQLEILVYEISGKLILQRTITQSTSNYAQLNVEELAKGIYLYEIKQATTTLAKGKFIKD